MSHFSCMYDFSRHFRVRDVFLTSLEFGIHLIKKYAKIIHESLTWCLFDKHIHSHLEDEPHTAFVLSQILTSPSWVEFFSSIRLRNSNTDNKMYLWTQSQCENQWNDLYLMQISYWRSNMWTLLKTWLCCFVFSFCWKSSSIIRNLFIKANFFCIPVGFFGALFAERWHYSTIYFLPVGVNER